MIAANDADLGFLLAMTPDQLRGLLAHASGVLAHRTSITLTADALRRVADRLEHLPK